MKPAPPHQKRRRLLLACLAGSLLLGVAYYVTFIYQPPLSAEEQLLVGEWDDETPGFTRIFRQDRTFATSNDQFAGRWRIEEGELTVIAWEPFTLPRSFSRSSFELSLSSLKRSFEKETYTWQIEFSDDGRQHFMSHPIDKLHPDGKWVWTKQTDKNSDR